MPTNLAESPDDLDQKGEINLPPKVFHRLVMSRIFGNKTSAEIVNLMRKEFPEISWNEELVQVSVDLIQGVKQIMSGKESNKLQSIAKLIEEFRDKTIAATKIEEVPPISSKAEMLQAQNDIEEIGQPEVPSSQGGDEPEPEIYIPAGKKKELLIDQEDDNEEGEGYQDEDENDQDEPSEEVPDSEPEPSFKTARPYRNALVRLSTVGSQTGSSKASIRHDSDRPVSPQEKAEALGLIDTAGIRVPSLKEMQGLSDSGVDEAIFDGADELIDLNSRTYARPSRGRAPTFRYNQSKPDNTTIGSRKEVKVNNFQIKVGDAMTYTGVGLVEVRGFEEMSINGRVQTFCRVYSPIKRCLVMVALENGKSDGLNPIVSAEIAADVMTVLAEKTTIMFSGPWNKRYNFYKSKINQGNIFDLAEVLRDFHHLKTDKPLSSGEKELLNKVRELVIKELSKAMNKPEDQVLQEVEQALGQGTQMEVASN